jgi:hypothetical protein
MKADEYLLDAFPKSVINRANTTTNWNSSDELSSYDAVDNLYTDQDISYQFNEYGLRCDSLSSNAKNVFLGCSGTEGIGVRLSESWSYLLNQRLCNTNYVSFAIAAHGIDTQANILYWYSRFFQNVPENIFVLSPPFSRRTLKLGKNTGCFSYIPGWTIDDYPVDIDALCTDKHFAEYMTMHSLQKIDLIARYWNANVYFSMWNADTNDLNTINRYDFNYLEYPFTTENLPDLARDKQHPGPETHKAIAESFYNQLPQEIKSD